MGKMIVAVGNYSKIPYCLKNSRFAIHSIEELCYYITKYPEVCEDFLYDKDLAAYIDRELGLKERSALLLDCIERGTPLKDVVAVIFCSCDYLVKSEIEALADRLTALGNGEKWQQVKNKADCYLRIGDYKNAIVNYRNLTEDAIYFKTPDNILGDVRHNLGIAVLHTEGFGMAAENFRLAFEKNRREESLRSYLIALKFAGKEEEYVEAIKKYKLPEKVIKWLDDVYESTERDFLDASELVELREVEKLLQNNRIADFYEQVDKMTSAMKSGFRKNNE